MTEERNEQDNQQVGLSDETAQRIADDIAPDDVQGEQGKDQEDNAFEDASSAAKGPEGEAPEGEPGDGQAGESPEDVAKSRAYHQRKAQEETEIRKSLEKELAEIRGRMEVSSSNDWGPSAPPVERPTEKPTPSTPQAPTSPHDDVNLDDLDLTDPADVRTFHRITTQRAAKEAEAAYDRRQQAGLQQQVNARWKSENETALSEFNSYIEKNNIPEEVIKQAAAKAVHILPDRYQLGVPSRHTELALEFIANWQVDQKRKEWSGKMVHLDADKVEAAKKTAQPAAAAPPAPTTGTVKKTTNDLAADEIAPDDYVLGS